MNIQDIQSACGLAKQSGDTMLLTEGDITVLSVDELQVLLAENAALRRWAMAWKRAAKSWKHAEKTKSGLAQMWYDRAIELQSAVIGRDKLIDDLESQLAALRRNHD